MKTRHSIRNLLIGRTNWLESRFEYKSAMLRGYMAVITLLVGTLYTIIDYVNGYYINIFLDVCVALLAVFTIYLNRRKKYFLSSIVFLSSINLTIFLFSVNDTYRSGVYMFFISSSLSAFALFGHRQMKYALMFSVLSLLLCIISYWTDLSMIPYVAVTEEYLQINFITNFITALVTCVLIVYFLIDINHRSEEKLVEVADELTRIRERNDMVIEAAQAGIYEWKRNENAVFISPTWKKVLGYADHELTDMSFSKFMEMVHPDDVSRIEKAVANHFVTRKPYSNEYRLMTRTGDYIWLLDTGYSKFDDLGNAIITVGSIIDINERKQSEEKILLQNALLAKANSELDRFVYSVSHDLRAPLSSIQGLTNVYRLTINPEEKESIIKLIRDRANTLDSFIREILDYSRNSRKTLNLNWVNVLSLVNEVTEDLNYMKGFDRLQLHIQIDSGLEVMTDRDRLKVVLNNLVANAVKYSDYGKNSFIRIGASQHSNHWSISIEDNGIGIKPEHHERIFDMFYQAHDHAQGSGLGLYIVKETVERLNGEIQMSSVYGSGTTFSIMMPTHPVIEETGDVMVG